MGYEQFRPRSIPNTTQTPQVMTNCLDSVDLWGGQYLWIDYIVINGYTDLDQEGPLQLY